MGCGKVTYFVVLSKARSLTKQMAYFLIPRSIARTVIMTKCELLGVLFQKKKGGVWKGYLFRRSE